MILSTDFPRYNPTINLSLHGKNQRSRTVSRTETAFGKRVSGKGKAMLSEYVVMQFC